MQSVFDFDNFHGHDFYHLRSGRGAIIVAVPVEDEDMAHADFETRQQRRIDEIQRSAQQVQDLRDRLKSARAIQESPSTLEFIAETEETIENLCEYIKQLKAQEPREFFANLQLARFYAHEITPQSEATIRFDRIVDIENLGGHLKICLEFSHRPVEPHNYHSRIGIRKKVRDRNMYSLVEGYVERIVPVENVTLEVVRRPVADSEQIDSGFDSRQAG